MNSMWLHTDLDKAAEWHFKEHQKLILEAGQMLATALNEYGLDDVSWYGSTHINHTLSRWVRESAANWFLLRDYMSALHDSFYGHTYDELRRSYERGADLDMMDERGEIHKTFKKVVKAHPDRAVEVALPDIGVTARPRCFGHGFEDPDTTRSIEESYRDYYSFNAENRSDSFTLRKEPDWL